MKLLDGDEGIATGHRPTWKVSTNGRASDFDLDQWGMAGRRRPNHAGFTTAAPMELLGGEGNAASGPRRPARRKLPPMARKSLMELGLSESASGDEIKARFKELAKRHHPDSSGGTGSEEKLREVIKAYNYLKKSGMC